MMQTPAAKNILIADPEPAIRRHVCDFLKKMGFNTDAALNGEEVMKCLAAREYCLVLLDSGLTGADGIPLDSLVVAQYPNVPVVVMSSAPSVRSVITAMRRGVFDYIIKPYEILELATIVPRAVERWLSHSCGREIDGTDPARTGKPVTVAD